MIEHHTNISIRYGETDQMGHVHHANYALYLEQARMDLFKSMGLDIVALEEQGIILPVVNIAIRYIRPLHFGDLITVKTRMNIENEYKMELKYQVLSQGKKLVARATTGLVFVKKETGKLIPRMHKYLEPMPLQKSI